MESGGGLPVAVIVERWHDINGVRNLVRRWGLEVQVWVSAEPEGRRRQLLELLASGLSISGLLIYGAEWEAELAEIQRRGIPVVVFGERSEAASSVAFDPLPVAELAIQHLRQLGHGELAFVAPPAERNYPLMHREVEHAYVAACRSLGLPASADRFYETIGDATSLRAVWRDLRQKHPTVQAVICEDLALARSMIRLVQDSGLAVPGDLSVLAAYDSGQESKEPFAVTSIRMDYRHLIQLAAMVLLDDIEGGRTAVRNPIERTVLCLPRLFRGETTASPAVVRPMPGKGAASAGDPVFPAGLKWPDGLDQRVAKVHRLNRKRFAGVNPVGALKYRSVDLDPYATRELARHYGWLGKLPLVNLPAGRYEWHGVPCEILDRAIVLRSRFARSVGGQPLPESVSLRINRSVDGVFILHAGGWLRRREVIGEYDFALPGRVEQVGVVAFGTGSDGGRMVGDEIIGDWHPSGAVFSGQNVQPCLVTEGGDPFRYLRYLYLYHWPNPVPGSRLETLTLRAVHPEGQATLGILAVTTYQRSA